LLIYLVEEEMGISEKDKTILRDLAKKVKEISLNPIWQEKINLWKTHNKLGKTRPMVMIYLGDGDVWKDIIPEGTLLCEDDYLRKIEFNLRERIYRWENLKDDTVIDGRIFTPIFVENTGFGITEETLKPEEYGGAVHYHAVIKEEKDIEKIKKPKISVDYKRTEKTFELVSNILGDILKIEKRGPCGFWFAPIDMFAKWRSFDQLFIDMIERPQWLHKVLNFITECTLEEIEFYEKENILGFNHDLNYEGSGGAGYTDELPQNDFDGKHVRTKDLWGHAATQIFSLVSPSMHEEFAIMYEKRLLSKFGLSSYGCCEPLHKKVDIIFKNVPNIRRISMSPWVDIKEGAKNIEDKAIFSWKPSPSILAGEIFEPENVRRIIRDGLEKTNDCVVEIIMKDVRTCREKPERLTEWVNITMEEAIKYLK